MKMRPTRPYIFQAIRQWIIDSGCTPFVFVRTDLFGVNVPEDFVNDHRIVLDLAPDSVRHYMLRDDVLTFEAVFGEQIQKIRIPMRAVLSIYAEENGAGWSFEDDEYPETNESSDDAESGGDGEDQPTLRVL